MPAALERKLKAEASKKFPGNEERQDAYVYGTLRKTGWTPSTQKRKTHVKGMSEHEVVTSGAEEPNEVIESDVSEYSTPGHDCSR